MGLIAPPISLVGLWSEYISYADSGGLDRIRFQQQLPQSREGIMADQTIYGPDLSLTADQQQLLRTALSSNRSPPNTTARPYPTPGSSPKKLNKPHTSPDPKQNLDSSPSNLNTRMLDSPVQEAPSSENLGNAGYDESPFLDFEDDGNFDWDANGDLMFGSLPGDEDRENNGQHSKRKNSEGDEEDGEGDNNKRHEGIDKSVKKPGRKPLNSSEPTTVSQHVLRYAPDKLTK